MALPIYTSKKPKSLVCESDPSIGGSKTQWRERADGDVGATVFTARWLDHASVAECYGKADGHAQYLHATTLGVVSVDWPGGPASVEDALAALGYLERVTLGAWILTQSTLPPDPTARPG